MQADGRKGTTMEDVAAAEEQRVPEQPSQPASPEGRPPVTVA
jgi:hypothetical protein